jgi:hypothetical protein
MGMDRDVLRSDPGQLHRHLALRPRVRSMDRAAVGSVARPMVVVPDYVIANDGLDALLVENAEMDPGDDEASNECVRDLVFGCWFRAYRMNDHVTCSCCTGRPSLALPPERKFLR